MTLVSQPSRLHIPRTPPILPLALASLLLGLAVAACSGGPDATVAPLPTDPPPAIPTPVADPTSTPKPSPPATRESVSPTKQPFVSLPGDEGAHLTPIEWWYFNGLLTDDTGANYSFHYVTFQSVLTNGFTPRLLQLSWADHKNKVYLTDERPELPLLEATEGAFAFQVADWSMAGDGTEYAMAFNTGEYSVTLQAVSYKPATLHQGKGLVDLGRAGESYYYSRTRLTTTGTLTTGEERRQVTGIAWMDHQWGDFSTAPVGWDWMSLQLDDGSDLMISMVWDSIDHQPINNYGTYVPPDGSARNVTDEDISLTATGSWTSAVTGTTFPMGWQLEVGSLALSVTLTPALLDSEFEGSKFVPPAYWEGAIEVNGTKNGQAVSGNGFAELVGYDTREFEFPNLGESNK